MELRWSDSAVDDLENIRDYIAKGSEFYAFRLTEKVCQMIEKLSLFPESGRMVPEVAIKNIREIILMNYRIIYNIKPNQILLMSWLSFMLPKILTASS